VDSESDGFEAFVHARTPALLRSAYLLTGDQHLAEDLVQSALVRTHRAWPRVSALGNAEAYTRKAMYHLQVSWWRRRRPAESVSAGPSQRGTPAQPDHAESAALRLSVRTALWQLPPRQRAVVVLRFFDDLTEAQTAEMLGVTVGTVKSQTVRALARLRAVAPELSDASATGGTR
jgi:RNA polymerase sigma-70 factor (sigma-E family)